MNARERWWWQATVWQEARGEPFAGQIAQLFVVQNRLQSGRFGRTIGEVVLAPFQFSCWNSDSPTRRHLALMDEETDRAWIQIDRAITLILDGTVTDPTEGACHYYNPNAVARIPAWDRGAIYPRTQIGNHIFVRGVP